VKYKPEDYAEAENAKLRKVVEAACRRMRYV